MLRDQIIIFKAPFYSAQKFNLGRGYYTQVERKAVFRNKSPFETPANYQWLCYSYQETGTNSKILTMALTGINGVASVRQKVRYLKGIK